MGSGLAVTLYQRNKSERGQQGWRLAITISHKPLLLVCPLSLAVGSVQGVPVADVTSTRATGCGGPGDTPTTWRALPVSPASGNYPRGRSLAWWRTRCCAGVITRPPWRACSVQLEMVRTISDSCGRPGSQRGPTRRVYVLFTGTQATGLFWTGQNNQSWSVSPSQRKEHAPPSRRTNCR